MPNHRHQKRPHALLLKLEQRNRLWIKGLIPSLKSRMYRCFTRSEWEDFLSHTAFEEAKARCILNDLLVALIHDKEFTLLLWYFTPPEPDQALNPTLQKVLTRLAENDYVGAHRFISALPSNLREYCENLLESQFVPATSALCSWKKSIYAPFPAGTRLLSFRQLISLGHAVVEGISAWKSGHARLAFCRQAMILIAVVTKLYRTEASLVASAISLAEKITPLFKKAATEELDADTEMSDAPATSAPAPNRVETWLKNLFPEESDYNEVIENRSLNRVLFGMTELRKQWQRLLDMKILVIDERHHHWDFTRTPLHCRIEGNPSTGKSTIAPKYVEFLNQMGFNISKVETFSGIALSLMGADDLVKLIESKIQNNGRMALIIDDAHLLEPRALISDKQLVYVLIDQMDKYQKELTVIFTGPSKELQNFFEFSIRLASRVQFRFTLPDLTDGTIRALFQKFLLVPSPQFQFEEGLDGPYGRIAIRRLARMRCTPGFTNVRAVNEVLSQMSCRQAVRIKAAVATNPAIDRYFFTRDDILGPRATPTLDQCKAWQTLQSMIGLDQIKASVKQLIGLACTNQELDECELPMRQVTLHRLFLGNPGTGKTTVAKLYAEILRELGLLSKGEVLFRTASEFIGTAVGESEQRTRQILASARGNVLLIDEAYALYPVKNGHASHGSKATTYHESIITTLVELVQNVPGEDLCVIMMGYKEPMEAMMREANPGLKRRFSAEDAFIFEDYTDNQLFLILNSRLAERSLKASLSARMTAIRVLSLQRNQQHFGNAGAVNNLVSAAIQRMEKRLAHLSVTERVKQDMTPQDFEPGTNDSLSDIQDLFSDMVGCGEIKQVVEKYAALIQYSHRTGHDVEMQLCFQFVGSPGTFKTSAARKMGKLFHHLGVLASGEVLERSPSDFLTGFVGQAGLQTRKIFEEALGKVLFIDEAYGLNPRNGGAFMKESLDELVKLLTDERFKGKMVVILAGYKHDMEALMRVNEGLRSRVSEIVHFQDLSAADGAVLYFNQLNKMGMKVDDDVSQNLIEDRIDQIMQFAISNRQWANGRDIVTLAQRTRDHVAWRCASQSKEFAPSLHNEEFKVHLEDVHQVFDKILRERRLDLECPSIEFSSGAAEMTDSAISTPIKHRTCIEYRKFEGKKDSDKSDENGISDDAFDVCESDDEACRDPGVSDAVWNELQQAKKRDILDQKALNHLDAALKEAQRGNDMNRIMALRREIHKRITAKKMKDSQMEKIKKMGVCEQGYVWNRVEGGYRCAGGAHFISDSQLQGF